MKQTAYPIIIGHRGARGLAPENTLVGFGKALEFDIDMIETDVRQTKDGHLVIIHKHLRTAEGHKLRVASTDYDELLAHKPDIPTLDEVITFINRRVRLMIEVKPGVPAATIIPVIQKYLGQGWQPDDFMFNSSSYRILKELRAALPLIDVIVQGNWSGARVTYLARKLQTPYILLDQRYVWRGFVWLMSRRHFKLVTYTFPWTDSLPYNHRKAEKWAKYGLYGLVTDYPDYFSERRSAILEGNESHAGSRRKPHSRD